MCADCYGSALTTSKSGCAQCAAGSLPPLLTSPPPASCAPPSAPPCFLIKTAHRHAKTVQLALCPAPNTRPASRVRHSVCPCVHMFVGLFVQQTLIISTVNQTARLAIPFFAPGISPVFARTGRSAPPSSRTAPASTTRQLANEAPLRLQTRCTAAPVSGNEPAALALSGGAAASPLTRPTAHAAPAAGGHVRCDKGLPLVAARQALDLKAQRSATPGPVHGCAMGQPSLGWVGVWGPPSPWLC
jgi:hypothetical protein